LGCSFAGGAGRSRAPIRRLRLGLLGGAHVGGTRRMGVSLALKGGIRSRAVLVVRAPGRGRGSCLGRWGVFVVVVVVMMVLSSLFAGSRRHERSSS
jgi:hypothetical protein